MPAILLPFSDAQEENPEDIFNDAEYFFATGEYQEAVYLFNKLVTLKPDHPNFNFWLGMSYLNIPGQEVNAIPFFEKAVLKTSLKSKPKEYKEYYAPHHAYFYLGNAYRINNELEKALESYLKFKDIKNFEKKYNLRITDEEIKACERAKIIKDTRLNYTLLNVGEPLNSGSSDYAPVLTPDESIIVFLNSQRFYEAIMYSEKINGKWTQPVNITPQVGSDGDMIPTSLSKDGTELYLTKNTRDKGDIYVSRKNGALWSKAVPLNENINTKANETFASLSSDGNSLYFTSDRKGTLGGLDIFLSKRQSSGEWGPAVNLGPVINTEYDEESPYLTPDGQILYFSSKGHFNMGGFDVFYSAIDNSGIFKEAVNAGSPISTTNDNIRYFPVSDGSKGYLAMFNQKESFGGQDIYRIEILPFTSPEPSITSRFNEDFVINLTNSRDGKRISILYEKKTDQFKISCPEGDEYNITVSEPK